MNRQEAGRIIEETFDKPFDEWQSRYFVKNPLNEIDESKSFEMHSAYIKNAFSDCIRQYKRIGTYTDPEGLKLDVLIVNLKRDASVERARTTQRNFVAHHLKQRDNNDAALVVFYSDISRGDA